MGDIADMILEGQMCQGCGDILGDGDGFATWCSSCQRDLDIDAYGDKINQPDQIKKAVPEKTQCKTCGKIVKSIGLPDHMKDAHGAK